MAAQNLGWYVEWTYLNLFVILHFKYQGILGVPRKIPTLKMHSASYSVIFTSLFQLISIENVAWVRSISACVYRCLYLADYFLVLCKSANYWTLCCIFASPGLDFSAVEGSAQVLRFWPEITLLLFLAQEKRSVLVVFWILAFLTGNTLYLLYTFSSQQLYNRWAKSTLYRMGAGDKCQGGKEGSPLLPHTVGGTVCP